MMRRSERRRAGISLIELLVVIAIIATLMGLVLSAVMRVLDVGPRGDTTSRMAGIGNAIGTFKSKYNVAYIPGGRIDDNPLLANGNNNPNYGVTVDGFYLCRYYTSATNPSDTSFEARYIKQVFPNANLADLGSGVPSTPVRLDANQTLLFFLNGVQSYDTTNQTYAFRGFSKNPGQPFAPFTGPEDRIPPMLDISNKHVMPGPNNFAWLVDGWKRPFAYFVAFNGKVAKAGQYGGWHGSPHPANGVLPYTSGTGSAAGYVNPQGFQIISAGKDGAFGPGGNWGGGGGPGADDRGSFSTNNLGAGPQ